MKNRSHRYDINRPRPRHGHRYPKYKMCLNTMTVICINPSYPGRGPDWPPSLVFCPVYLNR